MRSWLPPIKGIGKLAAGAQEPSPNGRQLKDVAHLVIGHTFDFAKYHDGSAHAVKVAKGSLKAVHSQSILDLDVD